jgi:hypothetical protein
MTIEQTKSIQAQIDTIRQIVMILLQNNQAELAQQIHDNLCNIEIELYNPEPVQPEFK